MAFNLEQYLGRWNAHDSAALTRLMTEDVVYEDMAFGERNVGHEAVARFLDRFAVEFSSDYAVSYDRSVVTEDGFAVEWVMEGTHDRSTRDMPASGKRFRVPGVGIASLRDGKIANNRDYWNMATLLEQVGMST